MTENKPVSTIPAPPAMPVVPPVQGASPAASPAPVATGEPAPKRMEVRNVLTLTFFGVIVVLATLIVFHFLNEYNRPKRELNAEMRAPDTMTDPAGNPEATGEWYLKRAREALNRRDTSTCQMLLEDVHDRLKKNKTALSPEGMQKLNDLEMDLQAILGE